MVSRLQRLTNKPVLLCLLVVVSLTLLLHTGQRFPVMTNNLLEGEEGGGAGERKGDVLAQSDRPDRELPKSEVNEAVNNRETVPLSGKASHLRPHPSITLHASNHSIKDSAKPVVDPEIFSSKPTITTQLRAADTRESVNKVLLLSSVGRSGSSFLGQLLAAQKNSVYFFEPIRGLPAAARTVDTTNELLRYFNCTVRNTVLYEGDSRNFIVVHFPHSARTKKQITPATAMKRCRKKPLVIIKTIRTRLKWVLARIQQNEFENVKVIHLVRDPRGSYVSMKKLKWYMSEGEICDNLYQDLQNREAMMSQYPSRYTFVKYEDLCRDPYGQARKLIGFIHGQGHEQPKVQGSKTQSSFSNISEASPKAYLDLPKGVLDFLNVHIHSTQKHKDGPYATSRRTSSMYQRWRWTITENQLKVVESACQNVIAFLGHRIFHNFTAVRNVSMSLFRGNS